MRERIFRARDLIRSAAGALFCVLSLAGAPTLAQIQAEHSDSALRRPVMSLSRLSDTHKSAYTRMTRQERWQDYKAANFESYGAFFQGFFTGVGDQLGNVPHWDSGMTGLSEHVGSEFATFTIAGTIHSSLAAALHQDTRYFPCTCRGGVHRAFHALSRTIATYGNNGHIYPDISGLAGIYGGMMVTTEWYPTKYTATGFGVRQANVAVGITSAIYVIREFSPEIKRAFHRQTGSTP